MVSLPGSPCIGDISARILALNGTIASIVGNNIRAVSHDEIGGKVDMAVFEVGSGLLTLRAAQESRKVRVLISAPNLNNQPSQLPSKYAQKTCFMSLFPMCHMYTEL